MSAVRLLTLPRDGRGAVFPAESSEALVKGLRKSVRVDLLALDPEVGGHSSAPSICRDSERIEGCIWASPRSRLGRDLPLSARCTPRHVDEHGGLHEVASPVDRSATDSRTGARPRPLQVGENPRLRRPPPHRAPRRGAPRTTTEEWDEFEQHFTLRRVELGSCVRPYGSTCEHGHACIRCPVLRVDPAHLGRLETIAVSLKERITEAEERGWAGEVEQLKISFQAASDKILATAPPRDGSVLLGLPTRPIS